MRNKLMLTGGDLSIIRDWPPDDVTSFYSRYQDITMGLLKHGGLISRTLRGWILTDEGKAMRDELQAIKRKSDQYWQRYTAKKAEVIDE